MTIIKSDGIYYSTPGGGTMAVPLNSGDIVGISLENMNSELIVGERYALKNDKFCLDSFGNWKLYRIHKRPNTDRKFWQFKKPKYIVSSILMERL